jgi:mono/diheme cytochrome c family protein
VALAGAAVLALVAAPALAQQRSANQCVACHSRLPDTTGAGHGFDAWRGSRHAAAGVTCDACHGGNPAATEAQAAHQGISRSSERTSHVYFTRIPDTCGRCHAAEAAYFRSSIHYARLESDGRGPNCVTCHGSMATSILTPERLLGTCSACHAPNGVAPVGKAREAAQVLGLVRVENILFDVVSKVAASRRAARGAARARMLLGDADRHLSAAAEVWHSFRLDSAVERLDHAREAIVAAWVALGYPPPREGQLHSPARRPR